jgi:hypothetical protein
MRLPWKSEEIHDILAPRVPYLRNLPTILRVERDMYGDVYAVCVEHNTQKSLKQAARILGCYFKREGNYDFAPYELKFHEHKTIELVLFLKQQHHYAYHVMGCVEFDHVQEYSNIPKGWMLHWAWMHPYCRGKGYLSKVYPRLLERYGDFYFLAPVSKAMLHVVSKCGSNSQKALFEDQE